MDLHYDEWKKGYVIVVKNLYENESVQLGTTILIGITIKFGDGGAIHHFLRGN